jgi:hypothetical protein
VTSSSSLKRWGSSFTAAKRTDKLLTGLLCLSITAGAVPLQNWRADLFRMAAEHGAVSGSPSGMFWDDLGAAGVMSPGLWPDSGRHAGNHWTLEPSLQAEAASEPFITGEKYNFKINALSDFRFHNFTVRHVLDINQLYGSLPGSQYPWHRLENEPAARIQEAYLQYTGKYGFVRLGRLDRSWGPFSDRSLLLSDAPFSYDAFEWGLHSSFFEFRHLFAALSPAFAANDTWYGASGTSLNRFFASHALNFMLGEWATIGLFESAIFSRDKGLPDFVYINPFSSYVAANTNWEGAGNTMMGLQGMVHPFVKKVTIKGQLLLDDFQVDDKTIRDQEPNHWAMDAAASVSDPLPIKPAHTVTLGYRYLSRWAYTVADLDYRNGERYSYLDRSLGNAWNDGDELSLKASLMGRNYWAAEATFALLRKGSNTIDSLWHDHGTYTLGYRDEPPLSERADLERTISLKLDGYGYFRDLLTLYVGIDNRWIKNRDHRTPGPFQYDPRLAVTLSGHYSDLFFPFGRQDR